MKALRRLFSSTEEVDNILQACKRGDLAFLKSAYEERGSFSGAYSGEGLNLLMIACINNHEEIVTWLLTGKNNGPMSGIKLGYKLPHDLSPPQPKKDPSIRERTARLMPNNMDDETKLNAIEQSVLLSETVQTTLHAAATLDSLSEGANVMHIAAQCSNMAIICRLLEAGGDRLLKKRDSAEMSPLEVAIDTRDGEVIYMLHEAQKSRMNDYDYNELLEEIDVDSISIFDEDRNNERKNILKTYFSAYKAGEIPSPESTLALRNLTNKRNNTSSTFNGLLGILLQPLTPILNYTRERRHAENVVPTETEIKMREDQPLEPTSDPNGTRSSVSLG